MLRGWFFERFNFRVGDVPRIRTKTFKVVFFSSRLRTMDEYAYFTDGNRPTVKERGPPERNTIIVIIKTFGSIVFRVKFVKNDCFIDFTYRRTNIVHTKQLKPTRNGRVSKNAINYA